MVLPKLDYARSVFDPLKLFNVIGDIFLVGGQCHVHAIVEENSLRNMLSGEMHFVQLHPIRKKILLLNPDLAMSGDVADKQILAVHVPFQCCDWIFIGSYPEVKDSIKLTLFHR